jgi:uncharacterized protein
MQSSSVRLTGIYIYPVKSLRGVRLDEVTLENGRLPGDRLWILVDENGRFMHQRDFAQMARVAAAITPLGMRASTDGLPDLPVSRPDPARASESRLSHVRLWRRSAPVVHVSREADEWFTEALGVRCRLLAFVPGAPALNVPDYEVHSSLQDATPFHLTSEDSLADLNGRMASPVPMNRFRPNLVVRGADAYAEDRWHRIAIGGHVFRWIKPCTRCVMTTTDQETGSRDRREPLFTLSTYRRLGSEVVFGHYVVAETLEGPLRVGDQVSILDTHEHPFNRATA